MRKVLLYLFIITCCIIAFGISACNQNVLRKKDTDNDGVSNRVDKCPATPSGVMVDINGCPLDTDQDGIADYQDKCPDAGGTASFDGCPGADAESTPDQNSPADIPVGSAGPPRDGPVGVRPHTSAPPAASSRPARRPVPRDAGSGTGHNAPVPVSPPVNRPPTPGELSQFRKKLTGSLAYFIPDSMKVDTTYKASLIISKNLAKKIIKEEIAHSIDRQIDTSKIVINSVEIFSRMAAKLSADTAAFIIRNTGSDDKQGFIAQPVDLEDTTSTNWFWDITPLKGGTYTLTIAVNIVYGPDILKDSKQFRVFHKSVPVKAIPPTWLEQLEAWIKKYPSFLSVLVLPFLGWGYKEFIKGRLERKTVT